MVSCDFLDVMRITARQFFYSLIKLLTLDWMAGIWFLAVAVIPHLLE
jgi:hypothetical protein